MTIPEEQLETWSKQGSVTQSKATYNTVKGVLTDTNSPYHNRSSDIFLQGSYGNDTNVYADSDVDVVICTSSVFYYDIDRLSEADKATFHREHPGSAQYGLPEFKKEVVGWLREHYGNAIREGNKAIFIRGDGVRRDADVLVCAEYRAYFAFQNAREQRRADGIVFWTKSGTKIVNYPKQHSANCTTKHQATKQWFKPTVRMFKNMRNQMIKDKRIEDGLAPSYFLEGLLYNIPNGQFGSTYQSTFIDCINWLIQTDRSKFVCANELHCLFQDGSPISWRSANCDRFLDAVVQFWNDG
jgi:hypothetical protein